MLIQDILCGIFVAKNTVYITWKTHLFNRRIYYQKKKKDRIELPEFLSSAKEI